jgi:hypothetical protein
MPSKASNVRRKRKGPPERHLLPDQAVQLGVVLSLAGRGNDGRLGRVLGNRDLDHHTQGEHAGAKQALHLQMRIAPAFKNHCVGTNFQEPSCRRKGIDQETLYTKVYQSDLVLKSRAMSITFT